jgi:integrase
MPKEGITEIINRCSGFRLKTYVMLLAATGMCAVEALCIRVKDIGFDNKQYRISVRGEKHENEN